MFETADIWKFFAGIGLFLLGLQQMDIALTRLAGRSFKTFLHKNTSSFSRALLGGTLVTALLQSSSVVSLITLGFVEAGMIPFKNALGVIMGSNLGSTVVGWIVATVGFKMDIESMALPALAISTIGMSFSLSRSKLYNFFRFLFALALLFLGLAFMKETAESLFRNFDITVYEQYPLFVFVLIGLVITSIIQTSSATMAIALTALYTSSITLPGAAALIIGSEVGTSLKTWIAGLKGSPEKKRAGYGNLYFNIATTILAFLALHPLLQFINNVLGIKDPLISLVMFQTLINLLTILLFIPFINRYTRWLEAKFDSHSASQSFVRTDLSTASLTPPLIHDEVVHIFHKNIAFHELALDIHDQTEPEGLLNHMKSFMRRSGQTQAMYEKLKASEGQLLEASLQWKNNPRSPEEVTMVDDSIDALRQTIHAAKSIKDIHHNMDELRESANDVLHEYFHQIGTNWKGFKRELLLVESTTDLEKLREQALNHSNLVMEQIHEDIRQDRIKEIEASSLLNVNREILSSKKAILKAWGFLYLQQ